MAHSVEILLESGTDAAIRDQWHTLEEAGLPSAGRIRAGTNRPHCTLVAGTAIAPAADSQLGMIAQRLPFPLRLGGAVVFPAGHRFTLARLVLPSTELLSVQAAVCAAVGAHLVEPAHHCRPGYWTPHLTLARRLTGEQLAAALSLLSWTPIDGEAAALRRWDGNAKTEQVMPGPGC